MLARLSLKLKLVMAFGCVASMLIVVGGISAYSNSIVVANYDVIAKQNLPNVFNVGQLRYYSQDMNRISLRATLSSDPEEIAKLKEEFTNVAQDYADAAKKYEDIPFVEGEEAVYKKVTDVWPSYLEAQKKVMSLVDKEGQDQVIQDIIKNEVVKARRALSLALGDLLKFHEQKAAEYRAAATQAKDHGQLVQMLAICLGLVIAIVLGFVSASILAKGLSRISDEISGAADQTSASGAQLSAASQQLSEGSSEAASSLAETVASLEELSSMVKVNAENAKEANNLSQTSSQSAMQGETEITKLITAMEKIATGSKKIEEIITVIDDIAFQTNLLALNAAVEAARAGEQGKGFAVVAEAVRTLAHKSSEAAKDINSLIKENVTNTESGTQIASESGVVLKDIVTAVKKVSDLNSQIASACSDQANGIEQISKAMNQLDQATQNNAASSEEVAASSEEMSSQAHLLAQLVIDLREMVQGKGSVTHHSHQQKPAHKINPENVIPMGDKGTRKISDVANF